MTINRREFMKGCIALAVLAQLPKPEIHEPALAPQMRFIYRGQSHYHPSSRGETVTLDCVYARADGTQRWKEVTFLLSSKEAGADLENLRVFKSSREALFDHAVADGAVEFINMNRHDAWSMGPPPDLKAYWTESMPWWRGVPA